MLDKKQKVAMIILPLIAFILVACGTSVNPDTETGAGYADGVYEGVGAGFNGDIKVSVTIADGEISAIDLLEINDTEGLGDTAAETVIAAVLSAKSTEVETVSGATLSSEGTIEAINAALAAASGNGGGAFTDGTYEGTAEGFGGPLTAQVTVEGGKITAIDFTEISETEGLGDTAAETVAAAIIEAQSVEVDLVSGATYSSEATIAAVSAALGLTEPVAEAPAEEPVEIDLSSLADGYYIGSAEGFKADIELGVVVEGGTITRIDIISQEETADLGDTAITGIIDQVVSTQNIQADTITGATYSSQGAVEAIEAALQGTPGEIPAVDEEPAEEEPVAEAPAETPAAPVETPETPAPPAEEPAPPAASGLKDGSYTGTSNNSFYGDPISVTITVSGGQITNVNIKQDETPDIGGAAATKLAAAIQSAQSANVDAVSGATITSNGIIEAAQAALAKAQ